MLTKKSYDDPKEIGKKILSTNHVDCNIITTDGAQSDIERRNAQ